ncbi:hypothetical protein FGRA07_04467 [Fusarium graminearum]|nr:hypothetical protein FGRA07_04467 [Fusarium graminearum]
MITTTIQGERTTYRTTAIEVETPTVPTALPTVDAGDNNDQAVLKYFPSAIAKESPISSSGKDNDDKGGLSTGALAGIIAGSVAFLIIVLSAPQRDPTDPTDPTLNRDLRESSRQQTQRWMS